MSEGPARSAEIDAWWLYAVPDRDAFGAPRYVLESSVTPPGSTEK